MKFSRTISVSAREKKNCSILYIWRFIVQITPEQFKNLTLKMSPNVFGENFRIVFFFFLFKLNYKPIPQITPNPVVFPIFRPFSPVTTVTRRILKKYYFPLRTKRIPPGINFRELWSTIGNGWFSMELLLNERKEEKKEKSTSTFWNKRYEKEIKTKIRSYGSQRYSSLWLWKKNQKKLVIFTAKPPKQAKRGAIGS